MVALALTLAALGAAAEAAAPPAKANILYLVADDMCARQRRRIFRMLLRASSDGPSRLVALLSVLRLRLALVAVAPRC